MDFTAEVPDYVREAVEKLLGAGADEHMLRIVVAAYKIGHADGRIYELRASVEKLQGAS